MSTGESNPSYLSACDVKVILPPFNPQLPDGLNTLQWIESVEKERTRRGWDDSLTLLYASIRLKEAAKGWFMDNVCGWPDLKLKLLRDFPNPVNRLKLCAQMMRRRKRPSESYEDYIINVGRVARKCNLNVTTTIRCIVAGLEDEKLKDHLLARSCKTISEVLTQIRIFIGQQNQGDLESRSHNSKKRSRLENLGSDKPKQSGSSETTASADDIREPESRKTTTDSCTDDCKDLLKIVRVGDVHLTAFVDLASRYTTIRLIEVKQHQWRMQKSVADLQISADVIGKLTENVKADDVEMVIDVVVVNDDAQNFPVVLGRNFLNKPEVHVLKTFNNLEIKYAKSSEDKVLSEHNDVNGEKGDEVDQEILDILECIERDCL